MGLVRTEILCSEVWGDRALRVELPPMYLDDEIALDFTILEVAEIRGTFRVVDVLHVLDSQGYLQRLCLSPDK